jgi:hypothetical protein
VGDTTKYSTLRKFNTSIYTPTPGASKYLVIASDDFQMFKKALSVFSGIVGKDNFQQVPHFDAIKKEGQFVVGGFVDVFSSRLYSQQSVAAPQLPNLGASSDFPTLPVQTETTLHDYAVEFSHLLSEVKRWNPAKAVEIEVATSDTASKQQWCVKMRAYIEKMKAAAASLE